MWGLTLQFASVTTIDILLQAVLLFLSQVIHRDLKLGNLFLNDDLEVKVGDFGLATKVEIEGERKRCVINVQCACTIP